MDKAQVATLAAVPQRAALPVSATPAGKALLAYENAAERYLESCHEWREAVARVAELLKKAELAKAEMDETKMRLEIGLADMESPAGLMKWKSSTRQPSEETRRKISEGRKAFLARRAAETAALAEPVQT